jgi:hypothetical protein
MDKESHSFSIILAFVFAFLFIASTIFAIWAFMGRQDYKNNVDIKIADASAVAVLEAESAKDAEFIEKEKSPVRTYKGPSTYGAVTFDHPKTWSVYAEESTQGTVLNLYAFPGVIPGIKPDQAYALRLEISDQNYDTEVENMTRNTQAVLTYSAYRPEKVPSVLGLRIDGEIEREVQGSMVLLPLRDRTIKIYTEIPQFVADFNNIILPSITFVP